MKLIPDEPGWYMEFCFPEVPDRLLARWPELVEMGEMMDGVTWSQLAAAIEGVAKPNRSTAHNILVVSAAISEWQEMQRLLS